MDQTLQLTAQSQDSVTGYEQSMGVWMVYIIARRLKLAIAT